MTLTSPLYLVLGLLVIAGLIVGVVVLGRRRSAALAAAGISLTDTRNRQVGTWVTVGGLLVLAVALSGPTASLPVGREAGTVILAMDVSNSMGATDISPTRLAAAQQAAGAFIAAQPENVDIGVVGFDQGALTTSLPNADHSAATAAVGDLRVSGGTSLTAAVLGSLAAITGHPVAVGKDGSLPDLGYFPSATVVLFSDGEDQNPTSADALAAAATAAENAGIHIDTVGVGTTAGTTIKIDNFSVHTALDEDSLTTVAKTSGGSYHPASDAGELNGIAAGIDLRLTVARQDVPLAGGFIGFALLLLAGGAVLTVARTGRLV